MRWGSLHRPDLVFNALDALSFLILVGVTLIVEGFDVHVPKGYIYFAMAFSVVVEMLYIRMRKKQTVPVKLHKQIT